MANEISSSSISIYELIERGKLDEIREAFNKQPALVNERDKLTSLLPLHISIICNSQSVFDFLLTEKAALPNSKDEVYHRSAFHWACILGRIKMLNSLIHQSHSNRKNSSSSTSWTNLKDRLSKTPLQYLLEYQKKREKLHQDIQLNQHENKRQKANNSIHSSSKSRTSWVDEELDIEDENFNNPHFQILQKFVPEDETSEIQQETQLENAMSKVDFDFQIPELNLSFGELYTFGKQKKKFSK